MKKLSLFLMLSLTTVFAERESPGFKFVVVGDRTGGTVENVFDEIIDEISLLHPDFVINVGNLIHGHTEDTLAIHSQWDTVLNIVQGLPSKFYFVPGSNDIQNAITREIYEKRTGCRSYYSFDYENCHFIILDNSTTPWAPLPVADTVQYSWLVRDLEHHKEADHIFVFLHAPGYLNAVQSQTRCPLMETFYNYQVRAVFSGNLHSYMHLNHDGVDYIVIGSSGAGMEDRDPAKGNFFHFLFVTVMGKEYDVAVIRKGNIFYRNVVTGSDYIRIQRAEQEVVTFSDCIIREGSSAHSFMCTMRVTNTGTDSITDILRWHFDPMRYSVAPTEIPLRMAPEDTQEYELTITNQKGSEVFPLPQYSLVFPFTYGKVCSLKNALGVKRLKSVKKIKTPPVINGNLDDEAWQKLIPITQLGSYEGQLSPIEKTVMYLCHDADNLYIGVRCFESDFSRIRAEVREHDGTTYADDNVWFFFDTNRDKKTYFQLIVNSNAAAFDRSCSLTEGQPTLDVQWNGPWEIQSDREDNAWTLEMKIPKQGLEPFNEKQWGFNFRRLQTRLENAGYWSLPFGHDPANFGILEFE